MIFNKENKYRDEIKAIGKKLYDLRLVVARSGNLSQRIDGNTILVTATGTSLGSLTDEDIIKVDLSSSVDIKKERLTSEFPLHALVYKNFPSKVAIHCHPTLINAYFAVYPDLKPITFETKLYLGKIPVVEQDTPTITKPELVIEALKESSIVVIKNHGVISIADKFSDALYIIEALEEAIKVAAVARIFKKDIFDELDKAIKTDLEGDKSYLMFSEEHIQAIVELVNKDETIRKKGEELDLTVKLAIKMDNADKVYKFNFEKGRIVKLDHDEDAPFVISAPTDVWEMIFYGKIDPFVATMQGKMKLKGEFGKLSRWYVPFTKVFEKFRMVKIK
ncbi:MAG: class II aldolase/adducin family protein [Candidatus Omnitrophica bacterium]|nr:class II aldolase/adducin family protein [Candidatus Omnitrophota bacterium]